MTFVRDVASATSLTALLLYECITQPRGEGRGIGVGRGRGRGVPLGVGVGLGVAVGVGVGLGVADGVGLALGVEVGLGVEVALGVGVCVGVGLVEGVGVGVPPPIVPTSRNTWSGAVSPNAAHVTLRIQITQPVPNPLPGFCQAAPELDWTVRLCHNQKPDVMISCRAWTETQ